MFRFESPEILYLLALLPLLALLFYGFEKMRSKRVKKLGNQPLIMSQIENYRPQQILWRYILTLLAAILVIIAASNPQWGTKREKVKADMADIYLAMDISNSMNAQDISPSRLERAKRLAEEIILQHKADQIALILFAGGAYLQMPLTHDYAASLMFLKAVNTQLAGTQGTDIEGAVNLAISLGEKNPHPKALIVFSDGEDHDGNALDAVTKAVEKGFKVFTIGVGTKEGGLVPASETGRTAYITDESGDPVRSVLNENYLKELATAGMGKYFNILQGSTILSEIKASMETIRRTDVESRSFSAYNSYFQFFLFPAILLLVFTMFLNGTSLIKRKST